MKQTETVTHKPPVEEKREPKEGLIGATENRLKDADTIRSSINKDPANRLSNMNSTGKTIDPTTGPDMTKPILDARSKNKQVKSDHPVPKDTEQKRSHEITSLIGCTIKLTLKKEHEVKSLALISNKGGVGKTHIATNIAFYLSRIGKKVLLIDLDLGNCDVTNKLGFYCEHTINDLLTGTRPVNKLVYTTPHGFDMIGGESGNLKLANMMAVQKKRFIRAFREMERDYDFILFDLSAGISATTLDFALAQDYQLIVTTPQDIVAGYSCIKATYQRFQDLEISMAKRDPQYRRRKTFRPFVILNQVTSFEGGRKLYEKMQKVVDQVVNSNGQFEINTNFLGSITSDPSRIRESELNHYLYSRKNGATHTGQCFNFLAENIVQYHDPNKINFTTKMKRFVNILTKSIEETRYAQ